MVMGEATADVWAAEFRRTGQVVFTHRPRRVWVETGLTWVWIGIFLALSRDRMLEEGGMWTVALVAPLPAAAAVTAWYGWHFLSRRPVLTVSQQGVRVGRRFLPWAEVGAIGIPRGVRPFWTLPIIWTLQIIPRDTRGKDLTVNQTTVKNIPALARWLEDVLKEQRTVGRPESASGM